MPFTAGWGTAAVAVADTRLSGGGDSDESEDALDIFFAMILVVKGLLVAVHEVPEVRSEV
jgi:hypothetical protein